MYVGVYVWRGGGGAGGGGGGGGWRWVSGAVEGVVVVVVPGAVGRGYWMWRGDRTAYANLSTDRPVSVTHQLSPQPT